MISSRGSLITARLASIAPERIIAYAFLALAYLAPDPTFDFEAALKQTKALFGYELFGYQAFFASDEAAGILEKHVRYSYFNLCGFTTPLYDVKYDTERLYLYRRMP